MQVIAFDQFCANVQRDVFSVLAMHHVNCLSGPSGSCKGNAPIIAGLNIPMPEPSSAKCEPAKSNSELPCESSPSEAVITISAGSDTSAAGAAPDAATHHHAS